MVNWFMRLLGKHEAELRGQKVVFWSHGRRDTWVLHSDAVQACKEAGIYKSDGDGERVLVDGYAGWSRWE